MTESTPFFSIVIPTYNRANFIADTINSVLNQEFKNFEIVVVNDGSTDKTLEVLEQFENKIKVINQENSERGASRNNGAKNAIGKYIYFLDSDDLLYPNHLKEANQFISKKAPNIFFQPFDIGTVEVKTRTRFNDNKPLNLQLIKHGNFMACHGVFIKSDFFEKNQFCNDRKLAGSEDYELWLRIANKEDILLNNITTSLLQEHDDRSVLNFNIDQIIERKNVMLEKVFQTDSNFIHKNKNQLLANTFSYISLHAFLCKQRRIGFKYLLKTLQKKPHFFFSRRFLAIVKHSL